MPPSGGGDDTLGRAATRPEVSVDPPTERAAGKRVVEPRAEGTVKVTDDRTLPQGVQVLPLPPPPSRQRPSGAATASDDMMAGGGNHSSPGQGRNIYRYFDYVFSFFGLPSPFALRFF